MNTKKIVTLLCVIAIGSFSSCKKKTSDPDPAVTTPVITPVNQLCDGNSGTSYYPLDSTDAWGYGYKISGVSQSIHPSLKVTGHQIYNSKKYALVKDASGYVFDDYLREDAVTHDIYRYDSNNNTEFLEIPSVPTLNQSWTYFGGTRTVTNLSASKATSGCSYTGLLEITQVNSGATLTTKYYYKKGLGKVYSVEVGSFPAEYTLTSTSLK